MNWGLGYHVIVLSESTNVFFFYFRTLHEAGPELKRTISGNLDEQEVIYLLKTKAKPGNCYW